MIFFEGLIVKWLFSYLYIERIFLNESCNIFAFKNEMFYWDEKWENHAIFLKKWQIVEDNFMKYNVYLMLMVPPLFKIRGWVWTNHDKIWWDNLI